MLTTDELLDRLPATISTRNMGKVLAKFIPSPVMGGLILATAMKLDRDDAEADAKAAVEEVAHIVDETVREPSDCGAPLTVPGD